MKRAHSDIATTATTTTTTPTTSFECGQVPELAAAFFTSVVGKGNSTVFRSPTPREPPGKRQRHEDASTGSMGTPVFSPDATWPDNTQEDAEWDMWAPSREGFRLFPEPVIHKVADYLYSLRDVASFSAVSRYTWATMESDRDWSRRLQLPSSTDLPYRDINLLLSGNWRERLNILYMPMVFGQHYISIGHCSENGNLEGRALVYSKTMSMWISSVWKDGQTALSDAESVTYSVRSGALVRGNVSAFLPTSYQGTNAAVNQVVRVGCDVVTLVKKNIRIYREYAGDKLGIDVGDVNDYLYVPFDRNLGDRSNSVKRIEYLNEGLDVFVLLCDPVPSKPATNFATVNVCKVDGSGYTYNGEWSLFDGPDGKGILTIGRTTEEGVFEAGKLCSAALGFRRTKRTLDIGFFDKGVLEEGIQAVFPNVVTNALGDSSIESHNAIMTDHITNVCHADATLLPAVPLCSIVWHLGEILSEVIYYNFDNIYADIRKNGLAKISHVHTLPSVVAVMQVVDALREKAGQPSAQKEVDAFWTDVSHEKASHPPTLTSENWPDTCIINNNPGHQ